MNFDDGQVVRKGNVLVQIDPTDYQVALDRAKADYQDALSQAQAAQYGVPVQSVGSVSQIRSATADMSSATAGVAAAQKQVDAAQQQILEAQANAVKLNKDVERYQQLLGKHEISQQQFDQAAAAATAANATVSARQAELLSAQAQVKIAESRIEQANAELKNAQATPNTVAATKSKADSAAAQALRSERKNCTRPGAAEFGLHDDCRSSGRSRRQTLCASWRKRGDWTGPDGNRAAAGRLGHSQLQGDATCSHAARAARQS